MSDRLNADGVNTVKDGAILEVTIDRPKRMRSI